METITIHDDGMGISRKSGTDEHGNAWIEFEVDAFAEQEPGTCSICGAELESGWMCLDGGEEVCDEHVKVNPCGYCTVSWINDGRPCIEHRQQETK